jgi:hypothetical protein
MSKQIGLWIDHKKAVIVVLSERGKKLQEIESGVGKHVRFQGPPRPRTPYSAQYHQGDDQLDKQYMLYLKKYYRRVIIQVRDADSLLVLGPGEAKNEFKKQLIHEGLSQRLVGIQSADKLTNRQLEAKIQNYFKTK